MWCRVLSACLDFSESSDVGRGFSDQRARINSAIADKHAALGRWFENRARPLRRRSGAGGLDPLIAASAAMPVGIALPARITPSSHSNCANSEPDIPQIAGTTWDDPQASQVIPVRSMGDFYL